MPHTSQANTQNPPQNTSIQSALIQACRVYYAYLEDHNLGCEEIAITQTLFADSLITLRIRAKMLNTDMLMIQVDSTLLPLTQESGFSVLSYDEKSHILVIECADTTIYNTLKNNPKKLRLFSDLKFLVRNIAEFFSQSEHFALPTTSPIFATKQSKIPYHAITIAPYLSDEQAHAVCDILQKPFSYVWGAPGSGKTQAVLFEALLHYIYSDVRVCVLAPTNSALEQVLKALIKKFDALGLDRSKILRLGTPSNAFAERYAESCDPQILAQKSSQNLFSAPSLKTRLQESLVVGLTIDGFIKRYKNIGVSFAHFFLDECAFTPLIKALTLTTQEAPITFLGDHKQLMPICEMPPSQIKDEKSVANLFNLSALFVEDFYTQPHYEASAPIFHKPQTTQLQWNATSVSILRKTHRYGDNLARILDRFIYRNGLCGRHEETELWHIDCSTSSTLTTPSNEMLLQEKHSHPEAATIAQFFPKFQAQENAKIQAQIRKSQLDSSVLDMNSIAIITPFVHQRKLLYEYQIPSKHTWTIHGSQGQEFDSVIFSPVVLHHYLTDSRNTNAAYALNVAISRIKKRLIIVCDYRYWLSKPNQFLAEILRHSKPYPLEMLDREIQAVESKPTPQLVDTIPI